MLHHHGFPSLLSFHICFCSSPSPSLSFLSFPVSTLLYAFANYLIRKNYSFCKRKWHIDPSILHNFIEIASTIFILRSMAYLLMLAWKSVGRSDGEGYSRTWWHVSLSGEYTTFEEENNIGRSKLCGLMTAKTVTILMLYVRKIMQFFWSTKLYTRLGEAMHSQGSSKCISSQSIFENSAYPFGSSHGWLPSLLKLGPISAGVAFRLSICMSCQGVGNLMQETWADTGRCLSAASDTGRTPRHLLCLLVLF